MTNYQKFVKELNEIWESGQQFGVKDGKPVPCSSIIACTGCKFDEFNSGCGCACNRQNWLKEDYKEDRSKVVIVASYEDIYKSIETALKGCESRDCAECAYNDCAKFGHPCEIDLVAEQIYQDCKPFNFESLLNEKFL